MEWGQKVKATPVMYRPGLMIRQPRLWTWLGRPDPGSSRTCWPGKTIVCYIFQVQIRFILVHHRPHSILEHDGYEVFTIIHRCARAQQESVRGNTRLAVSDLRLFG